MKSITQTFKAGIFMKSLPFFYTCIKFVCVRKYVFFLCTYVYASFACSDAANKVAGVFILISFEKFH